MNVLLAPLQSDNICSQIKLHAHYTNGFNCTRLATSCNILVFVYSVLCIVAYVCSAHDFDVSLTFFDNFVISFIFVLPQDDDL